MFRALFRTYKKAPDSAPARVEKHAYLDPADPMEIARQRGHAQVLMHQAAVRIQNVRAISYQAAYTAAYTVSPTGAKALMDICLPLRNTLITFAGYGVVIQNTTIDAIMNQAYPKLKAYVCMPPLAVSENRHETSNIYLDPYYTKPHLLERCTPTFTAR